MPQSIKILRYHNKFVDDMNHELNELLAQGYELHGSLISCVDSAKETWLVQAVADNAQPITQQLYDIQLFPWLRSDTPASHTPPDIT